MDADTAFDNLIKALYHDDINAVKQMILLGADINRCSLQDQGRSLKTPLLIASRIQAHFCVELLLEHGADPNIRPDNEYTALIYAARDSHYKNVELLLNAKADMTQTDHVGDTPLMHACRAYYNRTFKTLETLLNYGDDPNQRNDQGETPLMLLVKCRSVRAHLDIDYVKAADLLLQKGADLTLVDKNGNTALDIAKIYNKDKLLVDFINSQFENHRLNELVINKEDVNTGRLNF